MSAKYVQCSACGHRSAGWTYREAEACHLTHMSDEHPEIKLGTVIYV